MTEAELEELLSRPRAETMAALAACPGDVVVLGAGGKMGPTLARMAARAATDGRRVVAVSRFSSATAERALHAGGVETIRCDLLDRDAVARLPDAPNVVFMAGQKFGTAGAPSLTWAMNTLVPAHCAERYRGARMVAFSTGNVYPLTPVARGGSRENDPVQPIGEYAMSVVGRERVLEYYASRDESTRVALIRLNYAIDLRYGVLADIATRVLHDEPVPLDMGYVNIIWQGDANRIALESLPRASNPPFVLNLTGGEILSVRDLAAAFAQRLGRDARFSGTERTDALLSSTDLLRRTFSSPEVPLASMLDWVAEWVARGGPLLGKPTKFESRDGRF